MKSIIMGNSGSGKSTLAKTLSLQEACACLSLDEVAFEEGARRMTVEASIAEVERFISQNSSWVIEGCYADIIEALLIRCDQLIFLNPGTDICIAHCKARPWEPDKFASKALQDEHLPALLDWVRLYDTRPDEYGLAAHRRLYHGFRGRKSELTDPGSYMTSAGL